MVKKRLRYSRLCFETFSEGARARRHLPDWMEIYEGLATIFEDYVVTFERILELEEEQDPSPRVIEQSQQVEVMVKNHRRVSCAQESPP